MSEGPTGYPNFAGKHAHDAFINPRDFIAYARRVGRLGEHEPPTGVVLCYQQTLFEHIVAAEGVEPRARRGSYRGLVTLPRTEHQVGVLGGFGIGGPAAAIALEEFIAQGTTRFLSIGTAGSLQRNCPVGHTILCDRAIRDEGVSHHYLAPAKYVTPSPGLTAELRSEFESRAIRFTSGCSWTIDTPYRETVAEARHYQNEGVICVEMAAALFAVAEYRGIDLASAFVISDSLADLVWDPQFHSDETSASLRSLYEAAVAVLER